MLEIAFADYVSIHGEAEALAMITDSFHRYLRAQRGPLQ